MAATLTKPITALARKQPVCWVSPLTSRQLLALRLSLLPWLVAVVGFLVWWFNPQHHIHLPGSLIASALLLFQVLTPAYFYAFVLRMQRMPSWLRPDPRWRLAMVVTKAPSEPWPMVRTTLLAMLAQDWPHDTWLADEDPSPETIAWCADNGVQLSTRRGCPDYHRKQWPRRTRCKEGNLAYFYNHYGYERYDIVAQLDADHVPEPGYLRQIAAPFQNHNIGYVAAPSICDRNAASSWAARGRLHAEATLHGPLQMGYNNQWAPLCIGSHYAVRTHALREIGGLGPELAEDHSTSLMMNASGWEGAFQPDAIAHGDGPATFLDCMTQEYQWSRSLTMILLGWSPKLLGRLTVRRRLQFLFSQTWYLLFSSTALLGFLIPLACLVIGEALVTITYLKFAMLMLLVSLLGILPVAVLRSYGLLRPKQVPVLSWEHGLFNLMRFPWVLNGIISGVVSICLRRHVEFKITPKGNSKASILRTRHLLPYIAITSLSCLVMISVKGGQHTTGYHLLAFMGALTLLVGTAATVLLHHLETGQKPSAAFQRCLAAVLLSLALLGFAGALRLESGIQAAILQDSEAQLSRIDDQPLFGYHDATGSMHQAQVPSAIGSHFIPWGEAYQHRIDAALQADRAAGRDSIVTLEPWAWALMDLDNWDESLHEQLRAALLSDISAGRHDQHLLASLRRLAADRTQTVYVRLMHEMEIKEQYPWWSKDPQEFIRAYRHVVKLAEDQGLHNLRWIWSPAGFRSAAAFWPGDDVVDYVGLSLYATPEWNANLAPLGTNLSLDQLLKARYWVRRYGKPIILAEVGIDDTPSNRQRWFAEAIHDLRYFPEVVAWVYFNQPQPDIVQLDIAPPNWSLSEQEAQALKKLLEPATR